MYSDSIFDFLLGVPFVKDGQSPKEGFNCWSLHTFCRKHVNLPSLSFNEWIQNLHKRFEFIHALLKENDKGLGRFTKLDKPEQFACTLYKTKTDFHMGTVLPGNKKIIHIYSGVTVLKQELNDVNLPLVGFYNYA